MKSPSVKSLIFSNLWHLITILVVYYAFSVYYVYIDKMDTEAGWLLVILEALMAGLVQAMLGFMAFFWLIFLGILLVMMVTFTGFYFLLSAFRLGSESRLRWTSLAFIVICLITAGLQNAWLLIWTPLLTYVEFLRFRRLRKKYV
jgi:hypothetical protein